MTLTSAQRDALRARAMEIGKQGKLRPFHGGRLDGLALPVPDACWV